MEEKTVRIPSVSCGNCIMTIKRELGGIDGVAAVDGDLAAKKITVSWKPPATWESILEALDDIGFPPEA